MLLSVGKSKTKGQDGDGEVRPQDELTGRRSEAKETSLKSPPKNWKLGRRD